MILNEKLINYKVLDLVNLYNFNIRFDLNQDYMKSYEFFFDVRPFVGGPCTTEFHLFVVCLVHMTKGEIHMAKSLPCVTHGKGLTASGFFSQPDTPNRSTPVPVYRTGLTGYR